MTNRLTKNAGRRDLQSRKNRRRLAPCKQVGGKPRRWRGRRLVSGNTLQGGHATVQREDHVSDASFKPATIYWVIHYSSSSKVKYLRQSAALTAFGNPVFDNLLANIAVIQTIFRRAIGEQFVEGAAQPSYVEHPVTIDAANRYFVPKANTLPEHIRTLTSEVDPFGVLGKAAGSAYVHTDENKVYYSEKTCGSNGESM